MYIVLIAFFSKHAPASLAALEFPYTSTSSDHVAKKKEILYVRRISFESYLIEEKNKGTAGNEHPVTRPSALPIAPGKHRHEQHFVSRHMQTEVEERSIDILHRREPEDLQTRKNRETRTS
jgi:hypothetical protein